MQDHFRLGAHAPRGLERKRNIKNQWWHDHVTNPPAGPDGHEVQMVGLDCSIINPTGLTGTRGDASCGKSVDEARRWIEEAVTLPIESLRSHGESVPPPRARIHSVHAA